MSKIIEKIEFIYQFLNKPKTVGAITPSSRHLTKKILSFVDFKKEGLVLLEYGPGTGPFTSEIIKYLKPTDQLIVIELNPKFAADLKEKFKDHKNVKIHKDSVSNTKKILDKDGASWATIEDAYEKKGMHEYDALLSARMAYILRNQNYNNGKVELWLPTK